jgi:hypothetical protein
MIVAYLGVLSLHLLGGTSLTKSHHSQFPKRELIPKSPEHEYTNVSHSTKMFGENDTKNSINFLKARKKYLYTQ